MKRLTVQNAETLACKFRSDIGISMSEPVNAKTLLRRLEITAMYRPMSESSYGISCKSKSGRMFMLINSKSTRGRQHFTVAHELFHLFYDESPTPHICAKATNGTERNANLFAAALLLPKEGLLAMISPEEAIEHKVGLATILKIEQFYQVSRSTLLIRMKDIGLITENYFQKISGLPVKETAKEYGYDLSLYESGNKNLVISDFGEKARMLYEKGTISEGHYVELLKMIACGDE